MREHISRRHAVARCKCSVIQHNKTKIDMNFFSHAQTVLAAARNKKTAKNTCLKMVNKTQKATQQCMKLTRIHMMSVTILEPQKE